MRIKNNDFERLIDKLSDAVISKADNLPFLTKQVCFVSSICKEALVDRVSSNAKFHSRYYECEQYKETCRLWKKAESYNNVIGIIKLSPVVDDYSISYAGKNISINLKDRRITIDNKFFKISLTQKFSKKFRNFLKLVDACELLKSIYQRNSQYKLFGTKQYYQSENELSTITDTLLNEVYSPIHSYQDIYVRIESLIRIGIINNFRIKVNPKHFVYGGLGGLESHKISKHFVIWGFEIYRHKIAELQTHCTIELCRNRCGLYFIKNSITARGVFWKKIKKEIKSKVKEENRIEKRNQKNQMNDIFYGIDEKEYEIQRNENSNLLHQNKEKN